MTDDSNQAKGLRQRLRALLTAEFDGLAPADVADVLNGMASELQNLSEAGVQTISDIEGAGARGWSEELADAPPAVDAVQQRGADLVTVEAEDPSDVRTIADQALTLGAVVVSLDPPPELNTDVEVVLSFPEFHLTLRTEARVVHVSKKGTALELDRLTREDRAALEAVRSDAEKMELSRDVFDDIAAVPREKSPAEQSSGPWESVPIGSIHGKKFDRSFRRSISLTRPDVAVVASSQGAVPRTDGVFFGPEPPWIEASGDPQREDRLAEDRIYDVFLQASAQGLTGLVEVETDKKRFQITFERGLVTGSEQRPRAAEYELGVMLMRASRISDDQLGMAAAHADERGQPIGRSLIELDILDANALRQSIAGRVTFLVREVCKLREGSVRVFPSSALPSDFLQAPPLRVHVAVERIIYRLLYEELKGLSIKEREAQLQPALESYPELLVSERERLTRALGEEDGAFDLVFTLLNGKKRMQEVLTESALSQAETFAVIFATHRMGLVKFDRSLHNTIVRERFRENVLVKYLSVHKASYFEVLNVHWSSYDEAVRKAYNELILQFDPDQVPEHLEEEVHVRVGEIRNRVESAFQVLAQRDTRHAYRKRIMPDYKLAHSIPLFLKQSELAERRRQWAESKDALLRVLEIDPVHKDATYRLDRIEAIIDNRLSPDAADSNF